MPAPPSPTSLDFGERCSGRGLAPVVAHVASRRRLGLSLTCAVSRLKAGED